MEFMMSEFDAKPTLLFKTRTNSELGAESVEVAADGSIVFRNVLKKVTESMLTSYPRTQLGTWTPNRAALRFDRSEIKDRQPRDFETGTALSVDELVKRAS
jgi:hypothetical protein